MNFFHKYKSFNEGLDQKASVEEVQKGIILIKNKEEATKDKNLKRSLKFVDRVIKKSDVLKTDTMLQKHLINYDAILKTNAGEEKYNALKSDNDDMKALTNYLTELEKSDNKVVKDFFANPETQKTLAEAEKNEKELQDKIAKEEVEKKPKEEKPSESATSKMSEEDMKALVDKFKKAAVTTTSAPLISLTNNQSKEAIKTLQLFLIKNGYFPTTEALDETSPNADGVMGAKTIAAIKAFQADKGLKSDGVVGTQTWKSLLNDIKFGIDNDKFKSIKPATTKVKKEEVKKEDDVKTADPETEKKIGTAFKDLTGLEVDATAPVKTIDEIVKDLTNERMSSIDVPTDEKEVTQILLQQIVNKTINEKSFTDLLTKYKAASTENKKGLVADIIDAFDTDSLKINFLLAEMEPNKAKNSIIYDGIIAVGEVSRMFLSIVTANMAGGSFSDDTRSATALFVAFRTTQNADIIKELQAAKINVIAIEKVLNYKPAVKPVAPSVAAPPTVKPVAKTTTANKAAATPNAPKTT
jgi:hypothetical protein